jgi:hypothetical protein
MEKYKIKNSFLVKWKKAIKSFHFFSNNFLMKYSQKYVYKKVNKYVRNNLSLFWFPVVLFW